MPIRIKRSITINASAHRVWAVMTDIDRWPEWTKSVKSVERLDSGEFCLGSQARLRIRRAPAPTIWTVTELTPGRSFSWEANSGGVTSVATHVIEPEGDGSKVTLTVDLSGFVATILSPIIGGASRDNVRMEAEGLKRRSEESRAQTEPQAT